ncbi:6-O-methylguanine DNA methyltransferase [Phakopsora pachyrhizi]|nr:6-O-methylguanine DNA methyltransferase [Phakopsora pachyrhizi]
MPSYPAAGTRERSEYLNSEGKPISEFQWRVYDLTIQIPKGRITTYGHLAKQLSLEFSGNGRRMSSQAVGSALRKNPFAPTVPCHRVIKSNLYIGGFSGEYISTRSKKKSERSRLEGSVSGKVLRGMMTLSSEPSPGTCSSEFVEMVKRSKKVKEKIKILNDEGFDFDVNGFLKNSSSNFSKIDFYFS